MSQKNRLNGGQIDRNRPLSFSFDGKNYTGYVGDTLSSALLANNVRLMGRSFKYHRPRGVFSAGSEEPNALVELRSGARREPNTRATVAELYDGLEAQSQNRFPSLRFDALAVSDVLSSFLSAGFYYKTFMWPAAFWEKVYEPAIRRAAGLGRLSGEEDPDVYDKGFLHCDLLIIGAGPSGLAAALTAGRAGAEVILAEEDFAFGGRLLAERDLLADLSANDWVSDVVGELSTLPNVRLMTRTTVFGQYDHGIFSAIERISDHLPEPPTHKPRQILWRIYSKRALLTAGATERPIAFENNDRPGVMLAGALRAYANRWAVTPAKDVVIFTNNDDGHRTARDLAAKGVNIAALVDCRADAPASAEFEVLKGAEVIDSRGRLGLNSVKVRLQDGSEKEITCGAFGGAGGWNPNVHLTCHKRGRPIWNDDILAFVPAPISDPALRVAGAAAGIFSTHGALQSGAEKAIQVLKELDISARMPNLSKAEDAPVNIAPFWYVRGGKGRVWLDLQNDVTVKDIKLAHQEGFKSVEHVKRYTTLGMATDQGKTANLGALAVLADLGGKSISDVGTTIFRPPYTPVSMGAIAGRSRGKNFRPYRLTPSHKWAEKQGAVFVEAGNWLRAQWFPIEGETHWRQSVDREVLAVRKSVGVCDVTTLGKIDVQGTDAAEFLNHVYCNGFAKLPVGKARYGLMLREDGLAMDDGTAARLAEDHFVVTTTTANAVSVFRHMEFCRQCLWPGLGVQLISTTEAWAQFAVAGPNARKLLQKIVDPAYDISNEAFPYMACGEVTICGGLRARLFRISFSGELAYEIAVPTRYGDALVRRVIEAGREFDAIPYGTEALGVLRIEKGHAAGNELNGQSTAAMLGMGRMVSQKKDSIGRVLAGRPHLIREDDYRLVGLRPVNAEDTILSGAHLMSIKDTANAKNDQGWVTSAAYSPHVGSSIALAFLKKGDARHGEVIRIVSPLDNSDIEATVTSPHFIDPEGERLRV
ncbi:sarcosine oxidase subunit alpha family protein [Sneathiella sp.]|uniref:sarcosine oxidase subunit alpha family protein n=1 Tax=Sneathiella sp. TaxID=1964365 RepID=UPI002620F892|nr:sarcosine oxidase subunit alpha family protein [Sneathiella sp.]MDF2368881.1 sarcosine oxidase subunit alpha family protein [Sneathiella sp.]